MAEDQVGVRSAGHATIDVVFPVDGHRVEDHWYGGRSSHRRRDVYVGTPDRAERDPLLRFDFVGDDCRRVLGPAIGGRSQRSTNPVGNAVG